MPTLATASIITHFQELEDPRIKPATRHPLLDMVAIALCAVICGADTWVEVEAFGLAIVAWLRTFLAPPHDVPSHDTFGRVFAALDPDQFEAGFRSWVAAVAATTRVAVAIDGRTLRRSHDARQGKDALVLVSAWAEYVLALKKNQPTLWSAVDIAFREGHASGSLRAPPTRSVRLRKPRPPRDASGVGGGGSGAHRLTRSPWRVAHPAQWDHGGGGRTAHWRRVLS